MLNKTTMQFKVSDYTDSDNQMFYFLFKECSKLFGCHYMGYLYEDVNKQTRQAFTTHPDWYREYIKNSLISNCHLWKAVDDYFLKPDRKSFILPWGTFKAITSKQKDIVLYREEMDIGQNGISFCSRYNQVREFLFYAPEKNNLHFLKHISANMDLIKHCAQVFRRLSAKSTEFNFDLEKSNKQRI